MTYDTAYRIARSYDYNRNFTIDPWELYVDPVARNRLTYRRFGPVTVDELASGLARHDVYIASDRSVRPTYYPYQPYYPVYPTPYYYRVEVDPVLGNTIGGGIVGGVIGGLAGGQKGAVNGAIIGGALGFLSGILR